LELSQNIHHSSGSSYQPIADLFIQINKKAYMKKIFFQVFLDLSKLLLCKLVQIGVKKFCLID
jgi:hypothetical protein